MQKIFIKNPKQQNLAAILFPSSTKKIVIVCHGFKGDKSGKGKAIEMAKLFSKHFNVLLFDFRGCGESEGKFEDITLTGQIEDLNSVVSWAIQRSFTKIGCVGRSFGGTTALFAASQNKQILSVVSWAAPGNMNTVFDSKKYPKVGEYYITYKEDKELKIKDSFFKDIKKYNLFEMIRLISPRPVFILHGERDDVVPVETAYQLFEAANEPKRLEIIEEDDHIFSKNYKKVWEKTLNWFKESL